MIIFKVGQTKTRIKSIKSSFLLIVNSEHKLHVVPISLYMDFEQVSQGLEKFQKCRKLLKILLERTYMHL